YHWRWASVASSLSPSSFCSSYDGQRVLHSFPTRRSSDLVLVLMLPLLVWLTPDLRIKKSLLKFNWTIRKRLPRCKMRLKKRLLAFSRRLRSEEIAEMQNETQKEIAGIQSAT